MSDDLLGLMPYLLDALEHNPEHAKLLIETLESALLLAPGPFMNAYAGRLVACLHPLLADPKPDLLRCLVRLLDSVLLLFPNEGCQLLRPLLSQMLSVILERKEHTYPMVFTGFYTVLARVALVNRAFFFSLFPSEEAFSAFLGFWFELVCFMVSRVGILWIF